MTTSRIERGEREILGTWVVRNGKVQADETCDRIEVLTEEYLQALGCDASGWDRLYRDPTDGRYWELIYPESELHGGGPPVLRLLSEDEARDKYGDILG